MTTRRPDPERRLVPRWRSSAEAVAAGELHYAQAKNAGPIVLVAVPQFDLLISEWSKSRSAETAADLVSCGVSLGREKTRDVQDAAQFLVGQEVSKDLRAIAHRVLTGTVGAPSVPQAISFDRDLARMELQKQIAVFKYRVRSYPKNALAWVDLARLYTASGQQEKAHAAIQIALNLAPESRFVLRSTARFFVHSDGRHRDENVAEALHLLRKSQLIQRDPWIMAAEIALSTIADEIPRSLKGARAYADADSLAPWDSSELFGALATLALKRGGIGKPSKLFNKSLRAPTENALAQAQWASEKHKVVRVSESAFYGMQAPAFEALALKHHAERNWDQVIKDCREWSEMEPTSTRPLTLGGFVAEVALEDGKLAEEFSRRALLIAPNEPCAHNNLAVALSYLGRLDEAIEHASKYQPHELSEDGQAVYFATQGLIAYRRGEREVGLQLYLKAAGTEVAKKDPSFRALVLWHLLREEARLGAPGVKELSDHLWNQTKSMAVPELRSMYERIRNPQMSAQRRAEAILKSIAKPQTTIPSMRDILVDRFNKLL